MNGTRAGGVSERAIMLLIVLLFLGNALNYVDRQVLALLKPTLEAEFGWSDQEFAHLGSVFQLSAAFALLAVGWFVDRFGVRLAYGIAVAIWSAAGMAHAAVLAGVSRSCPGGRTGCSTRSRPS